MLPHPTDKDGLCVAFGSMHCIGYVWVINDFSAIGKSIFFCAPVSVCACVCVFAPTKPIFEIVVVVNSVCISHMQVVISHFISPRIIGSTKSFSFITLISLTKYQTKSLRVRETDNGRNLRFAVDVNCKSNTGTQPASAWREANCIFVFEVECLWWIIISSGSSIIIKHLLKQTASNKLWMVEEIAGHPDRPTDRHWQRYT